MKIDQLRRGLGMWAVCAVALTQSACVTVAEYRKLEQRVNELKARGGGVSGQSVADLRTELASVREAVARVEGRIETAEHTAQQALGEAQKARRDAASSGATGMGLGTGVPAAGGYDTGEAAIDMASPPASAELAAYRSAYDAWRKGETEACIDRFGRFLQTHSSSAYADDAAFWLLLFAGAPSTR